MVIYIGGGTSLQFVSRSPEILASTFNPFSSPVNAEVGDVIAFTSCRFGTNSPLAATGWTPLVIAQSGSGEVSWTTGIWHKRLTADDNTNISFTGTNSSTGHIVFRFSGALGVPTTFSPASQGTSGNPDPQIVNVGSFSSPLIIMGAGFGTDSTIALSMDPAADSMTGNELDAYRVGMKLFPRGSSPQNVTVDMPDEGNVNLLLSGGIRFV